MMFIEMSRDPVHGGGQWSYRNCVFAPTTKRTGSGSWPFWSNILKVKQGDIVLHLRGVPPRAFFEGYSQAMGNGFETTQRPPDPGGWAYSLTYYRADLDDYVPFHEPINLNDVFTQRRDQLERYFDRNKQRSDNDRLNIFYVRQSERLQCLNGAYFSEVDDELLEALFGEYAVASRDGRSPRLTVPTRTQIRAIQSRVGQAEFAEEVKKRYGNRCCFPGCPVDDPRFLVGAHIARWSDNEQLRGNIANGLCLCLLHDKAFEIGLYTIDDRYRVFVNPKHASQRGTVFDEIARSHGSMIRLASVHPLLDALLEHWIRVDADPLS